MLHPPSVRVRVHRTYVVVSIVCLQMWSDHDPSPSSWKYHGQNVDPEFKLNRPRVVYRAVVEAVAMAAAPAWVEATTAHSRQ